MLLVLIKMLFKSVPIKATLFSTGIRYSQNSLAFWLVAEKVMESHTQM